METEEKQDVSVDFCAVWDLELDVLAERAPEVRTNQKLGLLIGFLSVHDWYLYFLIHPFSLGKFQLHPAKSELLKYFGNHLIK